MGELWRTLHGTNLATVVCIPGIAARPETLANAIHAIWDHCNLRVVCCYQRRRCNAVLEILEFQPSLCCVKMIFAHSVARSIDKQQAFIDDLDSCCVARVCFWAFSDIATADLRASKTVSAYAEGKRRGQATGSGRGRHARKQWQSRAPASPHSASADKSAGIKLRCDSIT